MDLLGISTWFILVSLNVAIRLGGARPALDGVKERLYGHSWKVGDWDYVITQLDSRATATVL